MKMRDAARKSNILMNSQSVDSISSARDLLLEEKIMLQEQGNKLKQKIDAAKAIQRETGKWSDPIEFAKNQNLLRKNGLAQQKICVQLTKIKLEEKTIKKDVPGEIWGLTEEDWKSFHKVVKFIKQKENA